MLKKCSVYGFIMGLFLSPGWSLAKGVPLYQADELTFEMKNGTEYVYDKDGKLFSGAVILPDQEEKSTTYIYSDGQKNGLAIRKYDNEKIELETTYANGLKNGEEIKFTTEGKQQYKKNYKNDQLHGEYIVFYTNGQPQQKSTYEAGKLNGETTYFAENGNIERIVHYKNDIKDGVERIVQDNILVEENNYVNGKLNGTSKKYNEQYLTDEINYIDDKKEGKHIIYQNDGGRREIMYHNDMREGTSSAYYPNQKLAQQTDYRQNQKNGLSKKWNQKGLLRVSENYKNNQLDGICRYFDTQGFLQRVDYYLKGTKLVTVTIDEDKDLSNIYDAYIKGVLNEYSAQKNMWYKVLWLGLNTGRVDILTELKQQMQMYGEKLTDLEAYRRSDDKNFTDNNRLLFFGLSPLGYAVSLAAPVEILQQLTTSPKQINTLNPRGTTILQEAIHANNLDMVKYLLLNGADIKHKNATGGTILFDALLENASDDIILELLQAGVDINAKDQNGDTALSLALKKNRTEIVKLLHHNGAHIDHQKKDR